MSIEEVLIVRLNGVLYAINTQNVKSILRVSEITKVPFASNMVRGLVALEGSITTVYDFGSLVNNKQIDIGNLKSRLIVLYYKGLNLSLLIEETVNNIVVDTQKIEYIEDGDDPVVALYKEQNEIIQIISLDKLFAKIFNPKLTMQVVRDRYDLSNKAEEGTNFLTYKRYIKFFMNKELYAIAIDNVQEIITTPEKFTPVSKESDIIKGLMTLRGELLLVIDLRHFYKFKPSKTARNQIVIARFHGHIIGLLVDEIVDILDIASEELDKMPTNFEDEKISWIAKVNDEIISILGDTVIKNFIDEYRHLLRNVSEQEQVKSDSYLYEAVIFKLNGEFFGLQIDIVSEILDYRYITPIYNVSSYVLGIVSIRGQVIPLISMKRFIGLEEKNDIQKSKILVCQMDGRDVGFIVDDIYDVMFIKDSMVQKNKSKEKEKIFDDVIDLGKNIVLMINSQALIESIKNNS